MYQMNPHCCVHNNLCLNCCKHKLYTVCKPFFCYLIGEVERLLANDTATIEEIITIISAKGK